MASLVFLFLLIYAAYCCRKRRQKIKALDRQQQEEGSEENGEDWMEAIEQDPKKTKLPMDSMPEVPYRHEHPQIASPRATWQSVVQNECCRGTTASRVQPLPPLELYLPYGTMHSWHDGHNNTSIVHQPPLRPPALQENKLVQQMQSGEPCFEEPSVTCNACEVGWITFLACAAAAKKQAVPQAVPQGPHRGGTTVELIDMPNPNAVIFGSKGKVGSILPRVPKMPGPEALKLWESTVL